MIRKEAISIVAEKIKRNVIVSANGYISRDLYKEFDKPRNFYMIGSMGLASSIGLGIALASPKRRVYVFDGDGNLLMNLGSIITIGMLQPRNLVHIVFDNNSHESTGGQPTSSKFINIDHLAKDANYKVFKTNSKKKLLKILEMVKKITGPVLILVKVKNSDHISDRIDLNPLYIKNRFMNSLAIKNK